MWSAAFLAASSVSAASIASLRDTVVDVKIVPDLYQFVSIGGAIEEFGEAECHRKSHPSKSQADSQPMNRNG